MIDLELHAILGVLLHLASILRSGPNRSSRSLPPEYITLIQTCENFLSRHLVGSLHLLNESNKSNRMNQCNVSIRLALYSLQYEWDSNLCLQSKLRMDAKDRFIK